MYSISYWHTIREEMEMHAKMIREYEQQRKYEKSIVCSVPISEIEFCSEELHDAERWKPG